MQLEFREEYEPALAMFNNGLATRDDAQAKACRAGVARMTMRSHFLVCAMILWLIAPRNDGPKV